MSQRQSAPGPPSNTSYGKPNEPSRVIAQAGQHTHQDSTDLEHGSQAPGDQTGTGGGMEHRPSRPLDVNRILNPTPSGDSGTASRRRDAAHLESPPSSTATQYSNLSRSPNIEFGSPVYGTPQSAGGHSGSLRERIILTPRSPATRSISMGGGMNRPSITGMMSNAGTMSAAQTPFLPGSTGRGYSTGMSSSGGPELPPVPTSAAVHTSHKGHSYGFPHTAPTPPISTRQPSTAGLQMAQSQAASPSTSYSSFSGPSHASPGAPFRPLAGQDCHPSYQVAPPQGLPVAQPQGGRYTGSILEGRFPPGPDGNYPNHHPGIQIEGIDLENGSRAADEKRKRNAGASARFRARRKEREREASQTIHKLEQERDFYRSERDYFRGLVYSMPGHQQLAPRPLSPRLRPNTQLLESDASASGSSPWPESQPGDSTGRRTRRRTSTLPSTYHLPQLTETKVSLAGSPTGYTLAPPGADQRMDSRSLTCTDSNSVPRTAPYDPFHPGPFDRNRHSGR